MTEALTVATILLLIRKSWGLLYSNEMEVVEYVARVVPFVAVSTTFDGLQGVLAGVARGAGWQMVGAWMNIGSFYVVDMPVGCLLAFVAHFGGKGLLMGMVAGAFTQFLAFGAITHFTDWEKELRKPRLVYISVHLRWSRSSSQRNDQAERKEFKLFSFLGSSSAVEATSDITELQLALNKWNQNDGVPEF